MDLGKRSLLSYFANLMREFVVKVHGLNQNIQTDRDHERGRGVPSESAH